MTPKRKVALCPACGACPEVAVFLGLNLYTHLGGEIEMSASKTGEKQVTIPVEGMSCFTCELSVQTALGSLEGVRSSKANAKKGMVTVFYDPNRVSVRALVDAVNKTGYKASFPKE